MLKNNTSHQFKVGSAAVGANAVGASAIGSLAIGAFAVGAFALGALAIGRLVVGRLTIKRAHLKSLSIEDVVITRLRVRELTVTDSLTFPDRGHTLSSGEAHQQLDDNSSRGRIFAGRGNSGSMLGPAPAATDEIR